MKIAGEAVMMHEKDEPFSKTSVYPFLSHKKRGSSHIMNKAGALMMSFSVIFLKSKSPLSLAKSCQNSNFDEILTKTF